MNEPTNGQASMVGDEVVGVPQTEPYFDPNDPEVLLQSRRVRSASRFVAVSTALVALWIYLVAGEFVIAGVPEWLGWITVLLTTGTYYWALQRRLAVYMSSNTWRRHLGTLSVTCLVLVLALFMALILGVALPEPLVTVMVLVLIGIFALWKRKIRLRLYDGLWPNVGWKKLAQVVFIGTFTIFAMGALLARQ